jgi:hypothetical protein
MDKERTKSTLSSGQNGRAFAAHRRREVSRVRLWQSITALLFLLTIDLALILFDILPRPGFLPKGGTARSMMRDDGFEAFEGIAFAREFSERFQTFDSRTFKVSQVATAFLLDDEKRAERIKEIDRLEDKIIRGDVAQRARLMTLTKLPRLDEHFVANLEIELSERKSDKVNRSIYTTRLEFDLKRVDRTAQNPWGFSVTHLRQSVVTESSSGGGGTAPLFYLRPGVATLVRFPCSIENVELPKGTSVRVKLTTFDISELQLKTERPLAKEEVIRATCRDRAFNVVAAPETSDVEPLVILRTLTMANALAAPLSKGKTVKRKKTGVEKSIEEQLGFIVEE